MLHFPVPFYLSCRRVETVKTYTNDKEIAINIYIGCRKYLCYPGTGPVLSEGQYYTDETQTTPYTGRYTEFYDDGMLKMELYLKDGRPEGTYVIYYPDGKIAEVRSYYHGVFHGEWRTYNEAGQLIGLASYKDGEKDGPWRIWNDKGVMRFEMFYTRGKKSGVWRTWNDEGKLLTEEKQ